jgi:hypothetical protein
MLGGNDGWRNRRIAVVALLGVALIAGCGGDDEGDSKAKDGPQVAAASEQEDIFVERFARLLATTSVKKDCPQLDAIAARSLTRLPCPADKKLRNSMARFEVLGTGVYDTGAVIDYKSGEVEGGAAILLFVAPDRNWAVSRFGVVTPPSTDTSDRDSRAGYDQAVDDYLAAVRERDCKAFEAVAFTGEAKGKAVCDTAFAGTKALAKRLKANPSVEPIYAGGNGTYGFYTLETPKPKPVNSTISVIKAPGKATKPYVILDVAPSPTAAEQRQVIEQFREQQKKGDDQPETSPSRKAS